MKRRFNITGLCVPNMHYMVDISKKLEKIEELVDYGQYFTINRPRQFGKTTTLNIITQKLREKYIVIKTSFEGVSDIMFSTEEAFCSQIFKVFADSMEFVDIGLSEKLKKHQREITDYNSLSSEISTFVKEMGKGVVLLIDEVDKSSNSRTFLKFLGVLRNKYLARNAGEDITFQSVILAGVHNIKNLKLSVREENDSRFNSPWNISANFKVDMSFDTDGIEGMLIDYCKDNNLSFDTKVIANEIFKFTNGYPYLVSDICFVIEEELDRDWTIEGVYNATKQILKEQSTLFEDVIKNIENNEDIKAVVYEVLIEGRKVNYNLDAYEKGIMYGIFGEKNGKLVIHNKIFEERIYNFLIEQKNIRRMASTFTSVDENKFIENDKLNMEKALIKFQEFMYQEYRQEDEKFYETNGRLVFLAYLKPILNGRGFSFVEAETRQNKRMDIVIVFGKEKFVVELKIWNGEKYEEKGIKQLVDYLNIQNLNSGYLVIFNFNKNKEYVSGWIKEEDKEIFEIFV